MATAPSIAAAAAPKGSAGSRFANCSTRNISSSIAPGTRSSGSPRSSSSPAPPTSRGCCSPATGISGPIGKIRNGGRSSPPSPPSSFPRRSNGFSGWHGAFQPARPTPAYAFSWRSWIGRYFQWHVAETYPMNFVWPISTVPAAIILDWLLMRTRSFVLTSLFGGAIWAIMVWSFNYIPLAPFLQPVQFMHHILTVCRRSGHRLHPLPDARIPPAYRTRRAAQLPRRDAVRIAALRRHAGDARLLDRSVHRALPRGVADRALYQDASERLLRVQRCVIVARLARRHGRALWIGTVCRPRPCARRNRRPRRAWPAGNHFDRARRRRLLDDVAVAVARGRPVRQHR